MKATKLDTRLSIALMAVGSILLSIPHMNEAPKEPVVDVVGEYNITPLEDSVFTSEMEKVVNGHDNASNLFEIARLGEENARLRNGIESVERQIESVEREIESVEQRIEQSNHSQIVLSESDVDLLERLVEAEAGGESIEGRIAVANVIFNRIRSEKYPDDVRSVIYQKNQFEVVSIGTIDTKIPSEGTKSAVQRAINGEKVVSDDTVIFWAKYLDKSNPIWSNCPIVKTIGVHHFAERWGS